VFVLPSFSEGFSMAVLEAAACALPIVLTPQCNFPELIAADGAVEVQPTAESCEIGLRRVLSLSDAEREAMGSRGRGLVETHYNWRAVATKMAAVYAWLLHQGPKPATLIEN
jgi:glycosyltransferase involved in cell wall biosynthesis